MTDEKLKKKTDDELERIVRHAVEESVDYVESDIREDRIKAQKYFDGHTSIGTEEGRSKVVATKCRDAVRMVKPSLMRIFMQSDKPVEFVPSEENDVAIAEEQTRFAQYVFNRNGGFRLLNDVIDDALREKTGFAKVYYREAKKSKVFDFRPLSEDEFAIFAGNDDIEIIEHEQGLDGSHSGKAQKIEKAGEFVMEAMPPEEFFVNAEARSIDDFYVCGQRTEMRVGDLVEMGFDFDEVKDLGTSEDIGEEEKQERHNYSTDDNETPEDPSMKPVLYTEAYMRVDVDGTGVPQLHAFIMGGSKCKLLKYYPVDEAPFAVFETDPDPHTFFGRSLVELVMDDQDAATSLRRGVIDNVMHANNPSLAYDENKCEGEDMMNGEIGSLKRVNGSPHDAILPFTLPFDAGSILAAVQYYDEAIDNKTGVTRASAGLDPDALSNATATAVDATSRAAMAQPEVMARHLAEGGLKRLFKLLAKLFAKHPPREKMARLNGVYTEITPENWNPDFDMTVNVGLGTGDEATKISALNMAHQTQMGIWAQYGPDNGLVTMTNIRNTLGDILSMAGLHNTNRYYQPMTPEREAEIKQQAAEAAQNQPPPPPDPYVQGKQIEAQTKQQENQRKAQLEAMEMQRRDDLERDKMLQDALFEAADLLGKYGVPVDTNMIFNMQENN